MIVSNDDIRVFCKIGYNVTAADIYIEEAEEEVSKKLNTDLWDAVVALSDDATIYNPSLAYVSASVFYNGKKWVTGGDGAAVGDIPGIANTWEQQSDVQMITGYLYIIQCISLLAYSKMLVEHGIEVQGSGLVKYSGAESQTAITAQERAAMVNRYKNKSDAIFGKFMKWINDLDYTIDGTAYPFTDSDIVKHSDNFGIF